ncbi:MAG: GNAT family N-acetyltransferase [Capsulimonadales bacterium]|nr:GNAT family N-acetyltransferase [Capsulimonadales bacterium]
MEIRIEERFPVTETELHRYGTVPIAFAVTARFVPSRIDGGLGGLRLTEASVEPPYVKDYDAMPGEGPHAWASHFDLSGWTLFLALCETGPVGGAALAENKVGLELLSPRPDAALLYDLRVHPRHRGQGIGRRLFSAAEARARERGFRWLEVETQNTNVPACRFYVAMGCVLRMIREDAYPDVPDEAQMLWGKRLRQETNRGGVSRVP